MMRFFYLFLKKHFHLLTATVWIHAHKTNILLKYNLFIFQIKKYFFQIKTSKAGQSSTKVRFNAEKFSIKGTKQKLGIEISSFREKYVFLI